MQICDPNLRAVTPSPDVVKNTPSCDGAGQPTTDGYLSKPKPPAPPPSRPAGKRRGKGGGGASFVTSTSSSSKQAPWWSGDAEARRRRRVAGYKAYAVESKLKTAIRKGLWWIKDRCSNIVHGQ